MHLSTALSNYEQLCCFRRPERASHIERSLHERSVLSLYCRFLSFVICDVVESACSRDSGVRRNIAKQHYSQRTPTFVTLKVIPALKSSGISLVMESSETSNGVVIEEAAATTKSEETPQESQLSGSGQDAAAERDRLAKEKNELQELLQRRQAEFENFRRRSERERAELFEFASMDAVKALLPALDDFERALKVETADKDYARGMEMIYQRVFEALKKLGLEPIVNDVPVFNPHIHHAVEMVDTKDHPDQTILDEYQRGYYFKGRLVASRDGKSGSQSITADGPE